MEHSYPGVFEPVGQVLENLIAFPAAILSENSEHKPRRQKTAYTRLQMQEKQEQLEQLESTLNALSAELQRREDALSERWDTGRIYEIPTTLISANPHQPRRGFEELSLFALANSIREHGILQPLTIRRFRDPVTDPSSKTASDQAERYQLICGERRLRAAITAGMETVPCIILEADNRRAAELALIENLQRENLNLFEQAGAIASLIDMHSMTQDEIARALSVSQSYIANKLRILRLTAEERETILAYHLSERHARAFLRLKDLPLRQKTVRITAERGFNVAQTEQYIDAILTKSNEQSTQSVQTHGPDHPEDKQKSADGHSQKRKCLLRDLRLFFNTIERAVNTLKEAGYHAEYRKKEESGSLILTVSIACPAEKAANTFDRNTAQSTEFVSRETAISAEITNIQ